MVEYLKGVIDDFLEVITGRSAMPTEEKLFEVCPDESRILFGGKHAQTFHQQLKNYCVHRQGHATIFRPLLPS
jgi:hypothetical protein